ncbi:hypothetical protein SLEP1_g46164 [Rubroshorea leprosula]|uniref:Tyrosine-protein kinase catalytic domain-containing protein n=1 Tax=Rubroshorea leprosula TaxID=152421 RepID=A0AAV5LLC3_9ROSI|nr:hypothetical protein SLEP1_g46164 [Rubroshorea leprosula]
MVVATNNFSMANKLGQGGYGPVYKGKLHDGTDVAVKRLSSSSGQGLEEFKNEVSGYMSPEYGLAGIFSEKSDVFSFGVLLLEIVSGKKVTRFLYHDECLSLLSHAWQLWNKSKELDLIDEALADSFSSTEVKRCIQVALLCVQDHAENRPTMAAVISMLSSETELLQPKEPAFTFHNPSKFDQPNDNNPCSVCEVTTSVAEGR